MFNKYNNLRLRILILVSFIVIFLLDKFLILNFTNNNFINKKIYYIYKKIYYIKYNVFNFIKIINKKKILVLENNKLKEELLFQKLKNTILKKYTKKYNILKKILKIPTIKKEIITAKIIFNNKYDNILIINKGHKNNIKLGQPVINEYGIVGQITFVENNFSKVLLIFDRMHYIPSKIKRNNFKCILKGCGYKKELYLYNINNVNNDDIKSGDVFLTSGEDKKFPNDIPIAKIEKIKIIKNRIHNIYIKPLYTISDNNCVFIINKLNKI